MSECFFITSLLISTEKNFSNLALSPHMPLQKTVAHLSTIVTANITRKSRPSPVVLVPPASIIARSASTS
jgi:hypothetical protein